MAVTLDDLRRYAVARSLFPPVSLPEALERMGFVQADPIRAPARAQDLILRPRVEGYRAGDLERQYEPLGIHEDVFVNYGFVTPRLQALMHPRAKTGLWTPKQKKRAQALLDFVTEKGPVHPRDADAHFSHGTVENYWGGSSNATTFLLDALHYRGSLRVVRREKGIRIYGAHRHEAATADQAERLDSLMDAVMNIYAPIHGGGLSLLRRLRLAAPQWHAGITAAIARAKKRLGHARIDGVDWYWPAKEDPLSFAPNEGVRLLAPFDPVVWDRGRFELFWNWTYRFEAYTPASKRKLGYYALPLLWRDRVVGWANLSVDEGRMDAEIGYVSGAPRDRGFKKELREELERMRGFLGV